MKQNLRCYACIYCTTCDKKQEEKCENENYILYTTKEEKELCNLMCGEPQKDED